jgi:electron transfer flavoprotein beta subunit
VDGFSYDFEHNQLNRNHIRMILNPDDACALACALQVKDRYPCTTIEVVTMAPRTVQRQMQDLLRLQVDAGSLISDSAFAGSDTYATTTILATYLKKQLYDYLLTGTRSLDGATSHVPAQLAEALGLDHMQDITAVDPESLYHRNAICTVDDGEDTVTYEMGMRGILSLTRASGYKLPYIAYEDFSRDVSDKLTIVTNEQLQCSPSAIGLSGSLTRVVDTFSQTPQKRKHAVVRTDEKGISYVYTFLKQRGYV